MSTEKPGYIIRLMEPKDLEGVVDLHIQSFQGSRTTRLGRPFVRRMYHWFLTYHPRLAFVADAEADGKMLGFIVGSIGGSSRKIFKYCLKEIILAFLTHPAYLFSKDMTSQWQGNLKSLLPRKGKPKEHKLAPPGSVRGSGNSMAVSPAARGMHLGGALYAAFEEAAIKAGATFLSSGIEMDNHACRRMNERNGWVLASEDPAKNSCVYIKYVNLDVPGAPAAPTDATE